MDQLTPKIQKKLRILFFFTLTLGWKNEKRPSGPYELDLEAGNLVQSKSKINIYILCILYISRLYLTPSFWSCVTLCLLFRRQPGLNRWCRESPKKWCNFPMVQNNQTLYCTLFSGTPYKSYIIYCHSLLSVFSHDSNSRRSNFCPLVSQYFNIFQIYIKLAYYTN